MTAANAPSPYIVQGSTSFASLVPYKAFDNALGTNQYALLSKTGFEFVEIDLGLGGARTMYSYSLAMNTIPEAARAPNTWKVYGSNNAAAFGSGANIFTNWVEIDSRSGQASWGSGETRNFVCATTGTAYRYYRFSVQANNGDGSWTQFAEIYMYEADPVTSTPYYYALSQGLR